MLQERVERRYKRVISAHVDTRTISIQEKHWKLWWCWLKKLELELFWKFLSTDDRYKKKINNLKIIMRRVFNKNKIFLQWLSETLDSKPLFQFWFFYCKFPIHFLLLQSNHLVMRSIVLLMKTELQIVIGTTNEDCVNLWRFQIWFRVDMSADSLTKYLLHLISTAEKTSVAGSGSIYCDLMIKVFWPIPQKKKI